MFGGDSLKKRGFFILKILITIISLIILIIAKSNIDWSNLQNNYIDHSLVKEIAYDLAVGVFSAMILVWFIDEISNHIQEHQSQEKERSIIKRFDKVLQKYIGRYTVMFYCVATPIQNRNFTQVTMPENFTLKDMRDLHQTTLLMSEGLSDAAVKSFLEIEIALRREFIALVEQHDFNYYPEFIDIFLDFIQVSLIYDSRASILDATKRVCGERSFPTYIHDMLDQYGNEFYEKYLTGEEGSGNVMHPYVYLYELMKAEQKLILQYQEKIQKLS